jgi:putative nucleotidyltransferase with HDIG domain
MFPAETRSGAPALVPSRDDARRDALFRELGQLRELPPAPRTIAEIWDVLGRPESTARALADVLQRDAALSAKVLRLANSAYFSLPRPVSDVRGACVVLGFDTIRAMAVGVAALDSFSSRVGRRLDLDAFWRHSLGAATAAQSLARQAGIAEAGTAFCAGILHDVGKLVLATLGADRYRAIATAGPADLDAEAAAFGADHAETGAWLGARWHFPADVLEAIRTHHLPPPRLGRWGALVQVADAVAHRAAAGKDAPAAVAAPPPAVLALLPVDADTFRNVEAGFAASLERVEAFAEAARSPA